MEQGDILKNMEFLAAYGFDADAYMAHYDDLAGKSLDDARLHFAGWGFFEGRLPTFSLSFADVVQRRIERQQDADALEWVTLVVADKLGKIDRTGNDMQEFVALLRGMPDFLPAVIIGDSHSAFLMEKPMLEGGILPVPMMCTGGSARGLSNPASKAGYGPAILKRLTTLGKILAGRPVILKFGQVDVEFLFDMKRMRSKSNLYNKKDAHKFIIETVGRYVEFIEKCVSITPASIMVSSIFPPTLGDDTVKSGYVNAHIAFLNEHDDPLVLKNNLSSLVHPDMKERTELARFFNKTLKLACEQRSLPFIEEFDHLLNENGVVRSDISDPLDHHILLYSKHSRDRMRAISKKIHDIALNGSAHH